MEVAMYEAHPNLIDLPFDLQVQVMAFLDPNSLLNLRKTCKMFNRATSKRVVWLEALRRVCIENSVFLPTFPFDDMALLELEYAATAPRRWISQPEIVNSKVFLPSHMTRLLRAPSQVHCDLGGNTPGILRTIYLVPGGRYLVTFAWNWLGVWDLGWAPSSLHFQSYQPVAIAPVRFESMFLVHPTPDRRGFRIFLSARMDDDETNSNDSDDPDSGYDQMLYQFLIYEIYPDDDRPHLERIAQLHHQPRHVSVYSLSGDWLVFLHQSSVNVWDYKQNTSAVWTVNCEYEQIMVTPLAIILIHDRGVAVWSIPPLSSEASVFCGVHSVPVPPLFNIPYLDRESLGMGSSCEGPCDWYSGTPQRLLFDLVDTSKPGAMTRYEVLLDDGLGKAELVQISTINTPGVDDRLIEPYRFCEDTLVAWWHDQNARVIVAHTRSSNCVEIADPTFVSKEYPLFPMDQQWIFSSSLCPIAGRFVCLDPQRNVLILDYLLPCPESPRNIRTVHIPSERVQIVDGASLGPTTDRQNMMVWTD